MNNEIILDTKLVGDIEGKFLVPTYQRGYRWGADEVTRLLEDIYLNGKKSYCLQPIVVKKDGDVYELIDGQQRLTTLYLIYRYMNNKNPFFNEPSFSLQYFTHGETAEFLQNIDLSKRDEDINLYFIANAYETIQNWFETEMQIKMMHIFEYLKEKVKVIWYEVGESENAISLFTRLNIGKIPLTSAELVKAMFLSKETVGMDRKKQDEISLQWDNIEKELHNNSLWYFLTNDTGEGYQTRIDLILNLISGKRENEREKYYTFFKFDQMRQEQSLDNIWREKIQRTFLMLKDWYENHELYHKIGYLITSETLTLQDIFGLSANKTKSEFKALLDDYIKQSVKIKENYSELNYEKSSDRKKITRLLMLFNVESVRGNGEHTQWFPFDKFKMNGDGKVSWSLEHIHAQHSEGMRTQEVWKEWIELHISSVQSVSNDSEELLAQMQAAIAREKLDRNEFDAIVEQVMELLSVKGSTEYLHSISNLALLNLSDNAALNNSTFDVKRNKIIEMDKKGQYIPFCTKMVFLKYYTPSEKNQLHFWGQADRVAYINAINKVLAAYLEEPITIEKEDA